MRLMLGNRPILAIVLVAATFPAFAMASRALSPGGESALHQRPRTLKLQPLMARLGLKPVGPAPVELKIGEKVRATVVSPQKLAVVGIRGARAGDVAVITATMPAAQRQDQAAAAAAAKQAKEAAEAAQNAAGDADAAVSVETTDASGKKKTQTATVPGTSGAGLPTTAD